MNVLKKLGTPFVAVWRWIKETAWVQPLLIVGIIFAIIFSIPSITKWVQSWDFGDDSYDWLNSNRLSLEGCTKDSTKGEAAEFFQAFETAQNNWNNGNKEEARRELNKYTGDSNKMFLYFVQENEASKNINAANKMLVEKYWDEKVVKEANEVFGEENASAHIANKFKYKTIFTDQKITTDENDHQYDEHTAYEYLIKSGTFSNFYSTVYGAYQNSTYYQNIVSGKVSNTNVDTYKSNIDSLRTTANPTAPTLFIIDLTDVNTSKSIISNVVFSIDGTTVYERCDFLAQAWIGTEDFKA